MAQNFQGNFNRGTLISEAVFVDNYLDSVENLPDDVARLLSRISSIDIDYRGLLRDVDHYYDLFKSLEKSNDLSATIRKNRAFTRMSHSLIKAKELGDEKMQIVQMVSELIEQKTRQLDIDQNNIDSKEESQQHLHLQAVDDLSTGGVTTPKRIQSPAPIANGNGNGGSSGGGGGSSPNSERSGNNGSRLSLGNHANGNAGPNLSMGANETHRAAMKRSRRRNDTVSVGGNIELGGTESNSANEAGTSHIERKNSNASNIQKKSVSQNQNNSNAAGGSVGGVGGSASGSIGGAVSIGKKKKRRARGQSSAMVAARDDTPPPEPIDPDEPTYCVCNQISFGEMILCDNDLCPIEWFHFSCVALVLKPKGKWFCPNCRGDRPNVMKPKSQFLKELERYNKEKEEKT